MLQIKGDAVDPLYPWLPHLWIQPAVDTDGQLDYSTLQKGFEHPQVLVFARSPGTSPPQLLRDDWTLFFLPSLSIFPF